MASADGTPSDRRLELRKYPNRRYYDTTQGQGQTIPVTLRERVGESGPGVDFFGGFSFFGRRSRTDAPRNG